LSRDRPINRSGARQVWWILAVLLFVVLVPTACMLWFLSAAMRNSHLAARQQLLEVCQGQADEARRAVLDHWARKRQALVAPGDTAPAAAFAAMVRQHVADSILLYDRAGRLLYPAHGALSPRPDAEPSPAWARAEALEFSQSAPDQAGAAYAAIAAESKDPNEQARALQAQSRCLAKAGNQDQAVELLTGPLADGRYRRSADAHGRLIQPAAMLRAMMLLQDARSPKARGLIETLRSRLNRYDAESLPAGQRLFLMEELARIDPNVPLPTLAAERLAAAYLEQEPALPEPGGLSRATPTDLWHVATADGTVVAIFREARLAADLAEGAGLARRFAGTDAAITPASMGEEAPPLLSVPLGRELPGWRIRVRLRDEEAFVAAARGQNAVYVWTAVLSAGAMLVLASVVAAAVGRQMRLARLKNDLIATVSHELKTPLASIRVLVDTLVAGRCRDEQQAREYYAMIARENERLSRVIDNFLAFSRMERNKAAFDLVELDLADIAAAALESVAERFDRPGCTLAVDVAPDLPPVRGDRDALVTVVLNLLDNAHKYTGDEKRISLRAFADGAWVCLAVADNGVGMTRRAVRRVFDRFYQADQRLARSAGGCGLGLSIVRFIVDAHDGEIDVQSRPGEGSTFTVRLPAGGRGGSTGAAR